MRGDTAGSGGRFSRLVHGPWVWSKWEPVSPHVHGLSHNPEVRDLSRRLVRLEEKARTLNRRAGESDEQAARAKARQLAAQWGVELVEEPKPQTELSRPTTAEEKRNALVEAWARGWNR